MELSKFISACLQRGFILQTLYLNESGEGMVRFYVEGVGVYDINVEEALASESPGEPEEFLKTQTIKVAA